MRRLRNWLWRFLTGWCWTHDNYPEDMGGVIYNCCHNCNWVGPNPIVYCDMTKDTPDERK